MGVEIQVKVGRGIVGNFIHPKAIESQHPVCLIKSVLAHERRGNWVIYALAPKPSRELKVNLACLQDCARENPVFKRDVARLKKIEPAWAWVQAGEPAKAPGQYRCGC